MATARKSKTTLSRRKPPALPQNQDLVAAKPKGTWGGSRGGGRPRNADKYAGAIRLAEGKICDKLPHLLERMMDLAMGVQVLETPEETLARVQREARRGGSADPRPRVYDRPPDFKALQYLIDRVMGKPVQADTSPGGSTASGGKKGGVQIFLPDNARAVIASTPATPAPGEGGVMEFDDDEAETLDIEFEEEESDEEIEEFDD